MLKLNRTTEYGLIALRHLSQRASGEAASAREIAEVYGLPFDILAKTLQRLKEAGIVQSAQGARGGYRIQRQLEHVTLAEFLELMEGAGGVVACVEQADDEPACEFQGRCQIHSMMRGLNDRMKAFLSSIRLSEFTSISKGQDIVTLESFKNTQVST